MTDGWEIPRYGWGGEDNSGRDGRPVPGGAEGLFFLVCIFLRIVIWFLRGEWKGMKGKGRVESIRGDPLTGEGSTKEKAA